MTLDSAIHDFCFGLLFGLGFVVAQGVASFVASLLSRRTPSA